MRLSQALYRFALWAETETPHAIISFVGIVAVAYLLLARDGGAV